jgi:hypothetical protein
MNRNLTRPLIRVIKDETTGKERAMFMMTMPTTFKVGDTADCSINKKPARLTWRDAKTLVIEPDDARVIFRSATENGLTTFFCGDSGDTQDSATVEVQDGGFIVSHKP